MQRWCRAGADQMQCAECRSTDVVGWCARCRGSAEVVQRCRIRGAEVLLCWLDLLGGDECGSTETEEVIIVQVIVQLQSKCKGAEVQK